MTAVEETDKDIKIVTQGKHYQAAQLINCGGLVSDRIAKMAGVETDCKIIPFRGEYFRLPEQFNHIVKHLIYPIPDPELPFLGVHLTRMIDGSVTVGPNAVLAAAREGYSKLDINLRDLTETFMFKGFWALLAKYPKSSFNELKNSLFKRGYLSLVQKYCPQIQLQHLTPYPSGVRAQAVNRKGELVHDFLFADTPRSFHVLNAPSPAATSSLPISAAIVTRIQSRIEC